MEQTTFLEKLKALEDEIYQDEMAAMTLPKRGTCVVDEKTALMDEVYFKELSDYSASIPTGTFIGKRWKRNTNAYRLWIMGEYTKSNKPGQVFILWREIIIL